MPPRRDPPRATEPWRRTLYILFFAQVITAIGFSSIFPFLPLYVKSLGSVSGLGTELLSGLVYSSTALTMTIASPIWGALADRWGRKPMLVRAMFGGAVLLGLMAYVRSAEELVLLRAVQGLITGTIGAANALVAAMVPRARTGYAMGVMQVGMGIGVAAGPVFGGAVADLFGYRAAFHATGVLLALAGGIVCIAVEERFSPPPRTAASRLRFWSGWGEILRAPGVLPVYGLRFMNQMGRMIYVPVLPLIVLGMLPSPERVNSLTGLVIGASAAATAGFSVYFGRLGDRVGHRKVLVLACCLGFGFFAWMAAPGGFRQLLVLQVLAGVALGGIVPGVSALLAAYTRCGDEGAVYGLDNSVTSGARAVAPLLGVAIAEQMGGRAVFAAAAALYLVGAVIAVWGLPAAGSRTGTCPEPAAKPPGPPAA
jgi:DHA1 family multidrug resistance protein-like MFS transporter